MSEAKTADPLDRKFTLDAMQEKGIRGKYFAKVAKVFPNADAVNTALASIIELSKLTNKPRRAAKRKAA